VEQRFNRNINTFLSLPSPYLLCLLQTLRISYILSSPSSSFKNSCLSPSSLQLKMADYFAQFPGFVPNPAAKFNHEFKRLAKFRQWKTGGKRWKQERAKAINMEFARHYGANASKLQGWQSLCAEVGIVPVPPSITKCKEVS
jgi:hypothetical protein